jgi:hypothetical protein
MPQPKKEQNQIEFRVSTQRDNLITDVTKYTSIERERWKKTIRSLLFLGIIASVLIHIILGFILDISSGNLGKGDSKIVTTTVDFAVLDEEQLQEMPEGNETQQQEEIQSEASLEIEFSTSVLMPSKESRPTLESNTKSQARSLSGGGSSGLSVGVGGSGGGGASFFGIASTGNRFCYIVDISGSMRSGNRIGSALQELSKSIKALPDFAKFYILFYHSAVIEPPSQRGWNRARRSVVRRMVTEFQTINPLGGTNPILAFEQAMKLKPLPEVIYFLTDGDSLGFQLDDLVSMMPNKKTIVINTIAFGNNSTQQLLRDIANATGGKYNFISSGGKP